MFGNCCHIVPKMDELRLNVKFLHEYRDSCCIAFTETFMDDTISDDIIDLDNFTLIRADRNTVLSNKSKGGGLAIYINRKWCNNISVKSTVCQPDFELLTVNLRPFYLPREFSNIFINLIYIPPDANKPAAVDYLKDHINNLSSDKPDSLQIVMGDTNRTELNLPGFTQYVDCTTRKDAILDTFHCNVKQAYRCIKKAPLKNSDHNMLFMLPTYIRKLKRVEPRIIHSYQLSDENVDILNTCFDLTDWDIFVNNSQDIDELTDTVTEYLNFNFENLIPKKEIKIYGNNRPWLTSSLRKQIVEKHHAFKYNSPDYLQKQHDLDKAIFKAKCDYRSSVESLFEHNNMKDAWKGLKSLTGQVKSKENIAIINDAGSADRLNNFYARFDKYDFSQEHLLRKNDLLKCVDSEEPITISEEEVLKSFNNICVKKASGPDKICAKVVKKCRNSLLYIFHKIFNLSSSVFKMPLLWKIGEVIPVSKKPIPKVDNDLRPVTLTAILSKCFERIMLPKLMYFVKPFMDPLQFAYLPERCTDDAVNIFLHALTQHLDKKCDNKFPSGHYARCLFIDYSSAFNTMQPHILLDVLKSYNVPARFQLWILDFLTDRLQYVKTPNEKSPYLVINTGAPQGCVLSAFLFIIYTNSMMLDSDTCKIIKYADDTIVLGLISNNNETEYRKSIDFVTQWCDENYLELNVSKTKEMIFDFRKNQNVKQPVVIKESNVEVTDSYKYLGVTIQDNLKWDIHVNNQIKKSNKRMYYVYCLKNIHIDNTILCMFYNSVIMSILSYAISCWFNLCTDSLKKELNRFDRKMKKIVQPVNHHLISNCKDTYISRCRTMCNKIMKDCDHPLNQFYIRLKHHDKLRVMYCRTNRFKYSFVPSSISIFNSN